MMVRSKHTITTHKCEPVEKEVDQVVEEEEHEKEFAKYRLTRSPDTPEMKCSIEWGKERAV